MSRAYILLHEDGTVRFLRRKPDDNQASHAHGWMELSDGDPYSTVALDAAARFCSACPGCGDDPAKRNYCVVCGDDEVGE